MKKSSRVVSILLALVAATSTDAAGVKYHPGHYVFLAPGGTLAEHFRNIDEIASVPAVKGVQVAIYWSELETGKGVYNFSKIDSYLNKLKTLSTPKRLVVRVFDRRFGATGTGGIVPSYMLTDPTYKGGVAKFCCGYVAKIWLQPVNDRLIALYKALGTRYNANPYMEAFATTETSISFGSPVPSDYNVNALEAQYERFVSSARTTMPNTGVIFYANYLGGTALVSKLVQKLVAPDVALSSVNTVPSNMSTAQKVWMGGAGADYRGLLALGTSVEALELGGSHGNYTPKQLSDFAYNTLGVNYMFWIRNTWSGGAAQKWSTGILPFLKTNPPTRTGCPTSYGICNKN